jgi:hypothetical protein
VVHRTQKDAGETKKKQKKKKNILKQNHLFRCQQFTHCSLLMIFRKKKKKALKSQKLLLVVNRTMNSIFAIHCERCLASPPSNFELEALSFEKKMRDKERFMHKMSDCPTTTEGSE